MLYTKDKKGNRTLAFPGGMAFCPNCDEPLIPKCGEIKIWHWSHRSNADCDSWCEGETSWHRNWKLITTPEHCEVVFDNHRADIVGRNGTVIELQHSPIAPNEIQEREQFYGAMIWLFDVADCLEHILFRDKGSYYTFRWKWPRLHITYTTRPTFLDLGDGTLFNLKKMYRDTPCGGWGYFITKQDFIKRYIEQGENHGNNTKALHPTNIERSSHRPY